LGKEQKKNVGNAYVYKKICAEWPEVRDENINDVAMVCEECFEKVQKKSPLPLT
jgi:hypothetical protein